MTSFITVPIVDAGRAIINLDQVVSIEEEHFPDGPGAVAVAYMTNRIRVLNMPFNDVRKLVYDAQTEPTP